MNKIIILIVICVVIIILYSSRENFDTTTNLSCFRYVSPKGSSYRNDKIGYGLPTGTGTINDPPLMNAICGLYMSEDSCHTPKFDKRRLCQWGVYK